jgi:hypothetical protein
MVQGLIELIEYSYQKGASSFSEVYLERISRLSVLGLEQFGCLAWSNLGWVADREIFLGAHE